MENLKLEPLPYSDLNDSPFCSLFIFITSMLLMLNPIPQPTEFLETLSSFLGSANRSDNLLYSSRSIPIPVSLTSIVKGLDFDIIWTSMVPACVNLTEFDII